MDTYQRHATAFSMGGVAAAIIALITAAVLGRRPGYEIAVFGFLAGGIAMPVSLLFTWWGGKLGIGRAEIFLALGLGLVATVGLCVGIFAPV